MDKLILTHGDIDHIGGAPALLKAIKIDEVVLPRSDEPSELEQNIIAICKEKDIPVYYASQGDSWSTGDYRFYVLAPGARNLSRNNQSIVLFTNLGGYDWLFTGDLETKGEALLMAHFPSLSADVLKVGHHGSNTSTSEEFLDFLAPETALISAGVNNRFGHPHQEVTARLEERGIKIYQTYSNGAISYFFREERGTFSVQLHNIEDKKD